MDPTQEQIDRAEALVRESHDTAPELTDDPVVNWLVDKMVCDDPDLPYMPEIYEDEVKD